MEGLEKFSPHRLIRRMFQTKSFSTLYAKVAGSVSVRISNGALEKYLLENMPVGARALEVGSGPGLQAIELVRKRPDLHLIASDFPDQFVEIGRENFRKSINEKESYPSVPSLEFVQADAMDLSIFPEASFDGVYSIAAIKHFPDPVRGIIECLRLVKPGGLLVFSEIYTDCTLEEIRNVLTLFDIPEFLKPTLARIIRPRIQFVAPPIEQVKEWLALTRIDPNSFVLNPLTGFPVWILMIKKQ